MCRQAAGLQKWYGSPDALFAFFANFFSISPLISRNLSDYVGLLGVQSQHLCQVLPPAFPSGWLFSAVVTAIQVLAFTRAVWHGVSNN